MQTGEVLSTQNPICHLSQNSLLSLYLFGEFTSQGSGIRGSGLSASLPCIAEDSLDKRHLLWLTHTGCGEEWADEENALTSAEAQAFKRASSCFGLGRYLYNFVEMWVPLNEQRQPMTLPQLPKWALPKALGGGGRAHPPRPVAAQRGPIDQKATARIEGFRRILGNEIYREVLWRAADADKAEGIPNAQLQQNVIEAMERVARGIRRANSVAEQIGETPFIAVLDRLQISSMTDIPRLETLKALVAELEREVGRPAA